MISVESRPNLGLFKALFAVVGSIERTKQKTVLGLTAVCNVCERSLKGKLYITPDGFFPQSPITEKCLDHHEETRIYSSNAVSEHNTFTLNDQDGKNVGNLSVSSCGSAGLIDSSILQKLFR